MSLLERYINELTEELKIDDMNIGDVQKRLPSRRHFWAARLINHKRDLLLLQDKRKSRTVIIANELQSAAAVHLTKPEAQKMAYECDEIMTMTREIHELELIIEFLEKTEKNLNSMSFDLKNIIALMQMEMLE